MNLPVKVREYQLHIGLVDSRGLSIAYIVDQGGWEATVKFAEKLKKAINKGGKK